jgi:predicted house-cleaning NTP pyrophosphatase (Maf/HAM1 superfamily)
VSANSANARNKAAVVVAKSVVAVNKAVASKPADKPDCIS